MRTFQNKSKARRLMIQTAGFFTREQRCFCWAGVKKDLPAHTVSGEEGEKA